MNLVTLGNQSSTCKHLPALQWNGDVDEVRLRWDSFEVKNEGKSENEMGEWICDKIIQFDICMKIFI